jgi:hypothetical protein
MSVGRGNRNVRTKTYKSRLAHLGGTLSSLPNKHSSFFSQIRKTLLFTITPWMTPIEAGTERIAGRCGLRCVIG